MSGLIQKISVGRWVVLSAFLVTGSLVATDEFYENRGTVLNINIDAKRFRNSGRFQIQDSISRQPYSTLNTSFFTNTPSGVMTFQGGVGARFVLVTNNIRELAEVFVNEGQIEASGTGRIEVEAKKIVSPGRMISTTAGRVYLRGNDVDMERGAFSARLEGSLSSGFTLGLSSPRPTNYINFEGVDDVYWAAGIGGRMVGTPPFEIVLSNNLSFLPPPGPTTTPLHEVAWPARAQVDFLNSISLSSYNSYAWQNTFSTNHFRQVVLVNTNIQATNIGVDVRFARDVNVANPLVRFSLTSTNVATGANETNVLYFVDTSMSQTNVGLATNILTTTLRPRAFAIEIGNGLDSTFTNAEAANFLQDSTTFFPGGLGFTELSTTNYRYWAYGAEIGSPPTNSSVPVLGSGSNLSLTDATNKAGRVEIVADQLNLRRARVQAENTIQITTTNLISADGATFNAPNLVFDVAKTSGTLALTNFVPSGVTNFHGYLRAYSVTWTNTSSDGQRYTYQVLVLDAALLDGITQVRIPTMRIKAPNIVVQNKLNAARSLILDSPGVTFKRGTELLLDSTTIPDLLRSNFPSLLNLTNEGIISIPQLGDLVGDGTSGRLNNLINDGVVVANTLNIRATNFESAGTNGAFSSSLVGFVPTTFPLLSLFSGGTMDIFADAAKFEANAAAGARGRNIAIGDITISGNSLKMINQQFLTPSRMVLNITNLVSDGGVVGSNQVTVGRGFSVLRKPTRGDLLGTSIESVIPHDFTIVHDWPAEDRGKFVSGYSNNLALGKLTLSTTNLAGQPYVIRFAGTSSSNAMYVDLLDLRGSITNENLSSHLQIDPNMKIYFANATPSVDFVLTAITNATDATLRERLLWIPDFAGPNSSQLVSYVDAQGQVVQVTVNSAKFNSQFLDSDGDGVVNAAEDRLNSGTPFDGVLVRNTVGYQTNGSSINATITWRAAKETEYRIEVTSDVSGGWSFLTNKLNTNTVNGDVSLTDSVPAGSSIRFYRVGYRP